MKKPESRLDGPAGPESKRTAEMRPEYDFTAGTRGKYAARFAAGSNVVVLEPDVAELFRSSASVNRALRSLADLARRQVPSKRKKSA